MQHAEETGSRGADILGIGGQGLDRLAGRVEQRGVCDPLMTANPGAQPGRDGERYQEVRTGQKTVGLGLEPGLGLVLLAARAMSVAAGPPHGMGVHRTTDIRRTPSPTGPCDRP